MKLKIWGTRGSIPISGEKYIKYGGETSCYEIISNKNSSIILDTGTGFRRFGKKFLRENKNEVYILYSHYHWDHIMGYPFFAPLYMPTSILHMFNIENIKTDISEMFKKALSAPNFPLEFKDLQSQINIYDTKLKNLEIDDLTFNNIPLNHPNNGQGIKILEHGKSIVYLTDNELGLEYDKGSSFDEFVEFCKNCDILLHDSEFTPEEYKARKGWGHSCYLDSLDLALKANVKKFILIHHNQDRTDDEIDKIVEICKKIVETQKSNLIVEAAYEGMEIEL